MNINKLTKEQKTVRKRILEISFERRLSHLGSCFSVVDIILAVYCIKNKNDKFILSSGHAGVGWYAVLESKGLMKISDLAEFNIHPTRDPKLGIEVSSGSLGHGLPIAVGMALANQKNNIYCCISDGESSEGSIWEALRVAKEQRLNNLKVIVNANGWGAYDSISTDDLLTRIEAFVGKVRTVDGHNIKELEDALIDNENSQPLIVFAKTTVEHFPFLTGQDAHYYTMSEADYNLAIRNLK